MADIKTLLRELSVVYGIIRFFKQSTGDDYRDFFVFLDPYASSSVSYQLTKRNVRDVTKHKEIIGNGISLANAIIKAFNIVKLPQMRWVGEETQSGTPHDLFIDELPFSLKEESYILENMGLYRLVNILADKDYSRGELHVFKEFAPEEYERWFKATLEVMFQSLPLGKTVTVSDNDRNYSSSVTCLDNTQIELVYTEGGLENKAVLKRGVSLLEFEKTTNSLLREKAFAKYINKHLSDNEDYLETKRVCSDTAGKNLLAFVKKFLTPANLARMFRLSEVTYYYAKVVSKKAQIYQVPTISEFRNNFTVKDVSYSVPRSQLNLYTVIRSSSGQEISFRNEIRFSHGQFNGTPEAKMYLERGSVLETIYKKVYSD